MNPWHFRPSKTAAVNSENKFKQENCRAMLMAMGLFLPAPTSLFFQGSHQQINQLQASVAGKTQTQGAGKVLKCQDLFSVTLGFQAHSKNTTLTAMANLPVMKHNVPFLMLTQTRRDFEFFGFFNLFLIEEKETQWIF